MNADVPIQCLQHSWSKFGALIKLGMVGTKFNSHSEVRCFCRYYFQFVFGGSLEITTWEYHLTNPNFCQSRQKKGSKHTPIASVTPYSTSIHPFSYATSHDPSPESNKRPTNGHNYMTYSRRTASSMPIDPATDESTHLQATSSYFCVERPPSMM